MTRGCHLPIVNPEISHLLKTVLNGGEIERGHLKLRDHLKEIILLHEGKLVMDRRKNVTRLRADTQKVMKGGEKRDRENHLHLLKSSKIINLLLHLLEMKEEEGEREVI